MELLLGTTGSASSWECWDTASNPNTDSELPFRLGHDSVLDLFPGLGTPHAMGWPKWKGKKKKNSNDDIGAEFSLH